MTATIGYATLQIIPSTKGMLGNLGKELGTPLEKAGGDAGDTAGKAAGSKFKSSFMGIAAAVGGALTAKLAFDFGKDAIGAASDLNESMGKVKVVFGGASQSVIDWSKSSATAFGQSQQQALEAAGTYGNLFQAFGIGQDQAQTMSTSLVGLAADLASFNNTSVDDALQALQSGLSGETEPLKRFGVAINDARLKQEALSLGLIKSTSDALTPAAKAQASYSLIMKDTTLAQGDFARTSDGLANKQRIMAARFEDAKAKLGQALLPAMSAITSFATEHLIPAFTGIIDVFGQVFNFLDDHREVIIGVLAGAAVALGAWAAASLTAAIANGTLATSFIGVAAAQAAAIAPYVALAAGIAGLVIGVKAAYEHVGWFRAAVDAVASFLTDTLWPALKNVFGWLQDNVPPIIAAVVTAFQTVWGFISDHIIPIVQTLVDVYLKALKLEFDVIKAVITDVVIPALQGLWNFIATRVIPVVEAIASTIATVATDVGTAIGKIVGFVLDIPGKIAATISTLWDGLTTGITAAKDWISDRIDDIVDFVTDLPGRMAHLFDGMWDGMKNAFKAAINWIITKWNGLEFSLPSVDTHIPGVGKIGGWTLGTWPKIPALAHGTSWFGGGPAIINDAGPELVTLPTGTSVMTARATRQLFEGRTGPQASSVDRGVHFHGDVNLYDQVDVDGLGQAIAFKLAGVA
jgi:phage-related protein